MGDKISLVTGAGGFIAGHLVKSLKEQGHYVIGTDIKFPEFEKSKADRFEIVDLRDEIAAFNLFRKYEITDVYMFAADMGGMGFIQDPNNQARILTNNLKIDINTIEAARKFQCRVFYSSSACVYPNYLQLDENNPGLKEDTAFPAEPQDTYGWEKLTGEMLCMETAKRNKLHFRIARFHNIYGPNGTYDGGREKAPAALCRKVIQADKEIEIWGDGKQTRSFCYIDDCIEGINRLMNSDYTKPLNIGSSYLISINDMAKMIMEIGGKNLSIKHINGPEGVRGRTSDNTLVKQVLNWEPSIELRRGLTETYSWIKSRYD